MPYVWVLVFPTPAVACPYFPQPSAEFCVPKGLYYARGCTLREGLTGLWEGLLQASEGPSPCRPYQRRLPVICSFDNSKTLWITADWPLFIPTSSYFFFSSFLHHHQDFSVSFYFLHRDL
jgi:hypothetical protein